jgi:RNA polymerase-binding transcription factor DksA
MSDTEPTDDEAPTWEPDLAAVAVVEAELSDVERALARLDEGTYGTCEACGTALPDEQLEAAPAARLCREHQPA